MSLEAEAGKEESQGSGITAASSQVGAVLLSRAMREMLCRDKMF